MVTLGLLKLNKKDINYIGGFRSVIKRPTVELVCSLVALAYPFFISFSPFLVFLSLIGGFTIPSNIYDSTFLRNYQVAALILKLINWLNEETQKIQSKAKFPQIVITNIRTPPPVFPKMFWTAAWRKTRYGCVKPFIRVIGSSSYSIYWSKLCIFVHGD